MGAVRWHGVDAEDLGVDEVKVAVTGGRGFRVDEPEQLEEALTQALAIDDRPSLVEVRTSPRWT